MNDAVSVAAAKEHPLAWWREASPEARRALLAGGMGWALDAFDVMLYALVLASLMADLNLSTRMGGGLGSLTLLASAGGGVIFGVIADRYGRTRALMGSILLYSIFTAACGFAQNAAQLAVFRVLLGIGMGGEWASGAALVSETWPAAHRGKALALMQSSWAIGYAAAAGVTAVVLPLWGWRAVFFVGVLPALFTLWVRRYVKESHVWESTRARQVETAVAGPSPWAQIFTGRLAPLTIALALMNAGGMFGWWGFNLWVPAYLSLPVEKGGVGLSATQMSGLVAAMQIGTWLGYVSFGFISDRFGRKPTYVGYLTGAAVFVLAYAATSSPLLLLAIGPVTAFFATGHFSGFGAVTAEIYPTAIRATAQGFTYNIGRVASAAAPFTVASLAVSHGFGLAFSTTAAAFLFAAIVWRWIPETKGRALS